MVLFNLQAFLMFCNVPSCLLTYKQTNELRHKNFVSWLKLPHSTFSLPVSMRLVHYQAGIIYKVKSTVEAVLASSWFLAWFILRH
jgi:hypothetical protein